MARDGGAPSDLVTVVIPAYNAAATIDETLASVRAQTHRNLEILVIDDGSRDETPAIVGRHAREDPRVRLIRQSNGGVARARNRGIEEARAEFIAPVDADDLWRAEKIERQLAALHAGGDRVGLVYAWSALVDQNSIAYEAHNRPSAEGDVLADIYRGNIVGNGSTPLMRKAAVIEAGGFDPKLRDARAQGCEDLLLYAKIAENWRYALVPAFLVGYRQAPDNMSGDAMQMLRSWKMVSTELGERHPELKQELNTGECGLLFWLHARSLEAREFRRALKILAFTSRKHPLMGVKVGLVGLFETGGWWIASTARKLTGRPTKPLDAGQVRFLDPNIDLETGRTGPRVAYGRMLGKV